MSDREPLLTIHQPPAEDLANALMIAESWGARAVPGDFAEGEEADLLAALASVARLLRHALAGLSEPNEAAIKAALPFTTAWASGNQVPTVNERRFARDCAAAILNAQLRGESR